MQSVILAWLQLSSLYRQLDDLDSLTHRVQIQVQIQRPEIQAKVKTIHKFLRTQLRVGRPWWQGGLNKHRKWAVTCTKLPVNQATVKPLYNIPCDAVSTTNTILNLLKLQMFVYVFCQHFCLCILPAFTPVLEHYFPLLTIEEIG